MTSFAVTPDMLDEEQEARGKHGPVQSDEPVYRGIRTATKIRHGHKNNEGEIHPSRFLTKSELRENGVSVYRTKHISDRVALDERCARICDPEKGQKVESFGYFDVAAIRKLLRSNDGKRLLVVLDRPDETYDDHAHGDILLASRGGPVAGLYRSFDHVSCCKGDERWVHDRQRNSEQRWCA